MAAGLPKARPRCACPPLITLPFLATCQVKNVNHIPWAIVGSITGSGLLYFMLALALVLMTAPNVACPYATYFSSLNRLNFVTVFNAVGERGCRVRPRAAAQAHAAVHLAGAWRFLCRRLGARELRQGLSKYHRLRCGNDAWGHHAFLRPAGLNYMQYIVSVGALLGSTAALIVGLFSVSRVVMAASRDWLLPPFLARISPRTQTPVIAQLVLGFVICEPGAWGLRQLLHAPATSLHVSASLPCLACSACGAAASRRRCLRALVGTALALAPRLQAPCGANRPALTSALTPPPSAAIIGMVVNNNAMVPLVSFGTLSALWLVVNAMLYRRYTPGVHVRITR